MLPRSSGVGAATPAAGIAARAGGDEGAGTGAEKVEKNHGWGSSVKGHDLF
jgi:hypothetical protein